MRSQADLLAAIADRLTAEGILYMVVGSVASSFHGEPRTTVDIDIVIDPTAEALRAFVGSLPQSEFYVDTNAATEAFVRRTSFNVVDPLSGGPTRSPSRPDSIRPSSSLCYAAPHG